eukprot:TRINITY_DN28156_c0_g1_i1.p1 TRINITY_DN28156_c0_g1~~TRINITY_DN28156_c0_g1_i1.p1  ORF type:complete len:212 (+),score=40.41 TRINITY_DN28156_c0_g1_i1:83-718(+)
MHYLFAALQLAAAVGVCCYVLVTSEVLMFVAGCSLLAGDNILIQRWDTVKGKRAGLARLVLRGLGICVLFVPVTHLAALGGLLDTPESVENTTNGAWFMIVMEFLYILVTYTTPVLDVHLPSLPNAAVPTLLHHVYVCIFAAYMYSKQPLQAGFLGLVAFCAISRMYDGDGKVVTECRKNRVDSGEPPDTIIHMLEAAEVLGLASMYAVLG